MIVNLVLYLLVTVSLVSCESLNVKPQQTKTNIAQLSNTVIGNVLSCSVVHLLRDAALFSFAATAVRSIIGEIFFNYLGSMIPIWDTKLERRVENILKHSGVCGGCTILLLHSNDFISYSTTTLLGRHYIAISRRILLEMTDDEVSSIIAHEAGHLKNQDAKCGSREVFTESFSGCLTYGLTESISGIPGFVIKLFLSLEICSNILGKMVWKGSRRSEFLADEHSASIMGSSQPLISALEKMKASIRDTTTAQDQQLYRKHKHSFLQDVLDRKDESSRVQKLAEQIAAHQLIRDRIFNLENYARSNAWYTPVVRFLGMEEAVVTAQPFISVLQKMNQDDVGGVPIVRTPEDEQMKKQMEQLLGKKMVQDMSDCVNGFNQFCKSVFSEVEKVDAWYAPIVRLLGMEETFGVPKLNPNKEPTMSFQESVK